MSAFVVGKEHINAMIQSGLIVRYKPFSWYHNGKTHQLTKDNASEVGQMLLDENVTSVGCRYTEDKITNLPGKINAEWLIPFEFQYDVFFGLTAIAKIKIVQCYEYQSCEHDEWENSAAHAFCKALISDCIPELKGYDDAPWEYTKPVTTKVTRLA